VNIASASVELPRIGPQGGRDSTVRAGTRFATRALEVNTMADMDTPNRAANKDKAEGERSTVAESEQSPAIPNSESSTDRKYNIGVGDNSGGITNRPLDEEVENQEALPERGLSQADERTRSNEDIER
jgi:hypothetical protein